MAYHRNDMISGTDWLDRHSGAIVLPYPEQLICKALPYRRPVLENRQ
jgi:hypothetical protein